MINIHSLRWAVAPIAIGVLILSGCSKQEEASAPPASTQPTPAAPIVATSPTPTAMSPSVATPSTGAVPAGEMKTQAGAMNTAGGMKPKGTQCAADEPVKGNVKGDKKIYHIPNSKGYSDTKPEMCFKTAADAEKAGFRAPK